MKRHKNQQLTGPERHWRKTFLTIDFCMRAKILKHGQHIVSPLLGTVPGMGDLDQPHAVMTSAYQAKALVGQMKAALQL